MPKFFISYAHADNESANRNERWLDRVLTHLRPLIRNGTLDAWSDKQIKSGHLFNQTIHDAIDSADAAVLLISSNFLASDYISESEMPALLAQARLKGIPIIPVILKPCIFELIEYKYPDPKHGPEVLKISAVQAINSPHQALSGLSDHDQDQVLSDISRRLNDIANGNP